MSNLTAQIESIDEQIAKLADEIKELKNKREALAKLEDTYNETIIIVQETAALMVAGGLDPKVLATEIRNLIAPRKKSDKTESVETTEEYEVIEVEPVKPSATPIPTPAPTPEPVKTEPTVKHNRYGLSVTVADTSSKNYGRVEAKKTAPKTDDTPKVTPTPTEAPKPASVAQVTASNDVTTWSMTQLKEFCRKHWNEGEISAYMKDKGYKKVEKAGWISIVMKINAKLNSKKSA